MFMNFMYEYASLQDLWKNMLAHKTYGKKKEERQLTQQVLVSTDKSVSCLPVPSAAGG